MSQNIDKQGKSKYFISFLILSIAFIIALVVSLLIGRFSISIGDFLNIIVGKGDEKAIMVLLQIRLPRIIGAILIGSALSCAGAAFQGMFRNPMVSPDILGASSGACFGAALAILLSFSYFGITIFSFVFGLIAVILAYLISKVSKINNVLAMVLAGIMISSFFSAGTSFVKLVADVNSKLPTITYWLMGNLSSIKQVDMYYLVPLIVIFTLPLLLLSYRLNVLTLGDDEARSMGVNVKLLKLVVIICATVITSVSVSVSGMIGWVGLVIPHFSRKLFGSDFRRVFPSSILMGSTFLLICDDVSRCLTTSEIPIGILTAFVGAPVFIYMLLVKGDAREY